MGTNTKKSSYVRVVLSCEHEIWLQPPAPHLGEHLWCVRCRDYCEAGPGEARIAETFYSDYQWTSKPHSVNGWIGSCNVEGCKHSFHEKRRGSKPANWYTLRAHMERHYLKEHSGSSLVSQMELVPVPPKLPRNSPAPF